MAVIAKLKNLRISARKVRLIVDLIRGKTVQKAENILNFTIKKAAGPLLKLLKSAVSNAKNNFQLEESNLYISKITVDEGKKLKRWRARSRGQSFEIQKKVSHITITLDEIEKKPKKTKKSKKIEKVKKAVKEVKKVSKIKKIKPEPKIEAKKQKIEKGLRRIFRRKAF